ncbi:MAG: primosomal protein N' [candidate division Zixibacteria bacterium]|nr:primosomal protein N' [candidate division Zixibacteria bacterium]
MQRTFTYALPPGSAPLSPGQRVLVPFGRSRTVGFYLGPAGRPPEGIAAKPLGRAIDPYSYFSDELFALCVWMAEYYLANPADCLSAALPPTIKNRAEAHLVWTEAAAEAAPELRDLIRPGRQLRPSDLTALRRRRLPVARLVAAGAVVERWPEANAHTGQPVVGYRAARLPAWEEWFARAKVKPYPFDGMKSRAELLAAGWTAHYVAKAIREGLLEPCYREETADLYDMIAPRENLEQIRLTHQQEAIFRQLRPAAANPAFGVHLLHGVTGSGKTIVYCHLAREVVAAGRTVLVLTPEIALTGTTLAYFRGFFGDRVTVIHSAMSDRERLASFNGIRAGTYPIVIGPRSAIFAPLAHLGLVIVDEEHDPSYKQDDPAPRFHGRDCAIMRGRIKDVPVLLGSASPSIESYYQAQTGKYRLLELTERPAGATLPAVRVIDMKTDRLGGDLPFLSYSLKKEVDERLARDEQVILFLNRRGYSPQLKCSRCGRVPGCPNCQVKLTYHKEGRKLSCHYCGWVEQRYDACPSCGDPHFFPVGAGTQRVEETIPRLFERAAALRLDSDSATGRRRLHEILTDFSAGKANLLLGTQMVTKGLDLPGVTLVGVLAADALLDLPDFRASERAFAQLLQVAGRSGRAAKPGEVLIQTYDPEHPVIDRAAAQDYRGFYESEIRKREELGYPPYSRLVNFVLSGDDAKRLEEAALAFREELDARMREAGVNGRVLGPAPCPLYYLRSTYRRHLFVKTRQIRALVVMLSAWEQQTARFGLPAKIKVVVDVDPNDMM